MTEVTVDRAWIEDIAGAILTLEPMQGGGSRTMALLDVDVEGPRRHLVVRTESGGGPFAGTRFGSLATEAAVYEALRDTGLPVPDLVGLSADERHLVMTRLHGSNDFHGIEDDDEKAAVRRSFIDALAALHAIDPTSMGVDRLRHGAPTVTATSWLERWIELAGERVRRPAPVLRFALGWLVANAPADPDRPVICHGDVGPGNFLHAGGRVTALLDWELCHLGDRHEDLGMLTLRGHQLNGFGDPAADLHYYEEVSGTSVDRDQVRFHRAVAIVLGLVTSLMQLDAPTGGRVQAPLFLHLVPTLELLLVQALAELAGVALGDPPGDEAPERSVDVVAADVAAALRESFDAGVTLDVVPGAGPRELLDHLDASARLRPSIDALDLDEVEPLLGRRPASFPAALAALDGTPSGELEAATFLRWAYRSGRRRAALWPAWAPLMAVPLLDLG